MSEPWVLRYMCYKLRSRCLPVQVDQKNQEHELIIAEFERMKQSNMRLEITCKDYQEKILASESIVSNYKTIQEENRVLYNQVQDLRGNIRVFCRCAPTLLALSFLVWM